MTKTSTSQVLKKGNQWKFTMQGEEIASLAIMTFTLKEKLRKELEKMKYFLPCEDFKRSQVDIPKDEKGLQAYSKERESLRSWAPAVMYMHSEDKKDTAKKMCSDFLALESPDEVFVHKFTEALSDLSEVLTNFKHNAERN
jgi:hypothetical protein